MSYPDPTPIFHITPVDNLRAIAAGGGLVCTRILKANGTAYSNIAYETIQSRRATKIAAAGPGGVLHEYVPFYFAPRSPMLYAIKNGRVDNCPADQTRIVHLVATAQHVAQLKAGFCFTDGHAVMALTEYFDDLGDLKAIDWALMKNRYWFDTDKDPDRKRRRQAEFLAKDFVPWSAITEVGVHNTLRKDEVEAIFSGLEHQPPVKVRAGWYYSD